MDDSKIIELLIAFASGVILSLTSALVSRYLQLRTEKSKKKESARFKVYMNFLELHSNYFWVSTSELHREEIPANIKNRVRDVAWRTADLLRENDGLEYQEEIMDILFNERIASARDRFQLIENMTDKLGKLVNPKYAKKINKISSGNMKGIAKGGSMKSNAPVSHNL